MSDLTDLTGPITPEVIEARRRAFEKRDAMMGFRFEDLHDPGIVTLNDCSAMTEKEDGVLILVAWKIDDAAWKIKTAGQWRISDNDPDAKLGVHSFTPDSASWVWGAAPFIDLAEAYKCRDRILRLTQEFGLDIESFEATVVYNNAETIGDD